MDGVLKTHMYYVPKYMQRYYSYNANQLATVCLIKPFCTSRGDSHSGRDLYKG